MLAKGLLLATVAIISVSASTYDYKECNGVIEWTGGNFDFPNGATKSIYISSGRYTPKNIIATRAQIFRDEAILALPRYKPGVPVTLARVSLKQKGCEAVLQPFPCWSSQEEGNCNAFQSVVDLFVDANNILWVLDVGVVNTLESPIRKCPPKVVAINLVTGKKVKTLDLSGLVAQASRLQYVAVEYAPDGRPFAYISDAATRSILVFDIAGNRGYRVVLPKAVIGNGKRDVLYIALVQSPCATDNQIVFTYLSGNRVFTIKTEYLRAGSCAGKIQDLGQKDGKMVLLGTDLGNAIFFRYEGQPEVYRWEVGKCITTDKKELVYKSPNCYLATHAFPDLRRQRIRVLESNFPDYIQNTVGCGASQRISIMTGFIQKSTQV